MKSIVGIGTGVYSLFRRLLVDTGIASLADSVDPTVKKVVVACFDAAFAAVVVARTVNVKW